MHQHKSPHLGTLQDYSKKLEYPGSRYTGVEERCDDTFQITWILKLRSDVTPELARSQKAWKNRFVLVLKKVESFKYH